jgi:hypothetical protein
VVCEVGVAEHRLSALPDAEQFSGAALLQVLLGDAKAAFGQRRRVVYCNPVLEKLG